MKIMNQEDQNDTYSETLTDLALTTEEDEDVKAGSGATGGGGGAGKVQMQDVHFVAK